MAAAAAFLERSVRLTADPARRTGRTLAAAQANLQAGAFGTALELLATAEAGPLDEFSSARVDLLRGEIAFASGLGSDAPPLLFKAAKRLEPLNLELARETYLTAWMAALFAGRLAGAGDLPEVSRAARSRPDHRHGRRGDHLHRAAVRHRWLRRPDGAGVRRPPRRSRRADALGASARRPGGRAWHTAWWP